LITKGYFETVTFDSSPRSLLLAFHIIYVSVLFVLDIQEDIG